MIPQVSHLLQHPVVFFLHIMNFVYAYVLSSFSMNSCDRIKINRFNVEIEVFGRATFLLIKTGEDIRVDEISDMKKEYDGVLKKMRHLRNHEFDLENCEYLQELKRNLYMSRCTLEREYKLDENSYKTVDRIKKFVK